ncbi:hypothetical protein GCM10009836_52940 [Pseudonocardia ailaonensis]|uniref:Uncharacterized protein n=1 Tax=Pseudonocardia ailaonensis TaxID=367279 RepID=A0ABN2NES1_9PSEU
MSPARRTYPLSVNTTNNRCAVDFGTLTAFASSDTPITGRGPPNAPNNASALPADVSELLTVPTLLAC